MTKVCFERRGRRWRVSISGHAGNEDACRGVSMLVCTLAECLEREKRRGANCACAVKSGEAEAFARSLSSRGEGMLIAVRTGFSLLAESYPENVELRRSL